VAGGEDVAAGVVHDGALWTTTSPPDPLVRRFDASASVHAERLPATVLRLVASEGTLFADTPDGLFRRDDAGWRLAVPRPPALPAGSAHLSALSFLGPRIVAGVFGGGLVVADGKALAWREVPGSAAWGVNALLPAGGTMFVASLRGAARYDGARLAPIPGPGAAFSLAATRDGVAIGYAQGVLLPGSSLVSAFHGLPGNQATALAAGESLFVGTPSGLGALDGRRVRWRAAGNEGRLPHPWVQALLVTEKALYVGTYGGGLARRPRVRGIADGALLEPFPETEGVKTSTGALVEADGRVFAGTEGRGLWRLRADGERFEPLALPLPSPRVTALAARAGELWVGTDEGLLRLPLAALGDAP
jgi:ligand-binding sensor domain-containing protein